VSARASRPGDGSTSDGGRSSSQPASITNESRGTSRQPAAPSGGEGSRSLTPQGDPSLYCEIDGLAVEIQCQDLSPGGLFVQTPSAPPVDSEVEVFLRVGPLRLEASGHIVQSVSCDGAKRERRRPGFGLLFTQLEDDARAALRDALEALIAERARRAEPDYEFARPSPQPDRTANTARREPPRASPVPGQPRSNEPARARSNEPAARDSHEPIAQRVSQPARPPAAAAPAIDPKEHELLATLKAELATVESQPPWTILGIAQGADQAAARTAFFAAAKRYHPHSFARYALPEIKTVVTQLFIVYKRAFTTMTKPGRGGRGATRAPGSGNPPVRSSDPGNR
jgi:Tfp pilus assembly protein PilZ